jgi:hypothetical protein
MHVAEVGESFVSVLVPSIVFSAIVAVVWIAFYFHHRNRRLMHDSVLAAIQRSGAADPMLIASITRAPRSPRADLRLGMILVSLALATMIFAALLHQSDALGPLLGIAAFPGLVGLAFIGFYALGLRAAAE